jgi:dCMP deaminase
VELNAEKIDGNHWDLRFLQLARMVATWSKDPSTKCGCIIVDEANVIKSQGYNGLPRGIDYTHERVNIRPDKYRWTVHAEENAVCNAARVGSALSGCTAYITGPPCDRCMREMLQAGIVRVVIPEHHNMEGRSDGEWNVSCEVAEEMMGEVNIIYHMVEGL